MKHYAAPARAAFRSEILARRISTKPLFRGKASLSGGFVALFSAVCGVMQRGVLR